MYDFVEMITQINIIAAIGNMLLILTIQVSFLAITVMSDKRPGV